MPDAVLFDMDGLLVDTEPLWTVAEHELAAAHGAVFTKEAKAAVVGTRLDVAVPLLLQHLGVAPTPERVAATSTRLLDRMVVLFAEPWPLRPGAAALLDALRADRTPVALVSSSYRVLVDAVLATGVGPFATTVAGDEVRDGKPAPEPYFVAAARLGVDPARCVVLEDSPAGAASGLAAGCAVVAVPSVPGVRFPDGRRLHVTGSLEQVDLELLAGLAREPAA